MSYEHVAKHLIADQIWDIVALADEFTDPMGRMSEMELAESIYKLVMEARDVAKVTEMAEYYGEIK